MSLDVEDGSWGPDLDSSADPIDDEPCTFCAGMRWVTGPAIKGTLNMPCPECGGSGHARDQR